MLMQGIYNKIQCILDTHGFAELPETLLNTTWHKAYRSQCTFAAQQCALARGLSGLLQMSPPLA